MIVGESSSQEGPAKQDQGHTGSTRVHQHTEGAKGSCGWARDFLWFGKEQEDKAIRFSIC
jgi:hypothetical protein